MGTRDRSRARACQRSYAVVIPCVAVVLANELAVSLLYPDTYRRAYYVGFPRNTKNSEHDEGI